MKRVVERPGPGIFTEQGKCGTPPAERLTGCVPTQKVPQSGRFVNHMQRHNISLLRRWEDVASNSVLSAPC